MPTESLERPPRGGALIDTPNVRLQHESFDMPFYDNAANVTDMFGLQSEGNPNDGDDDGDVKSRSEPATSEVPSVTEQEEIADSQSREAAEVAAAARFISQVDSGQSNRSADPTSQSGIVQKPRFSNSTNVRDSILESTHNISKAKMVKPHAHAGVRRSKTTRPPPLQLAAIVSRSENVEIFLPERSSSKGAPSFHLVRSTDTALQSQEQALSPKKQDASLRSPPPVLTPESATTFRFDFDIPNEPRLSRSGSAASTISQSPATPATGPSDDQVRKDIEAFALEQSPHLRGSQRRTRRPPVFDTTERENEFDVLLPPSASIKEAVLTQSSEPTQAVLSDQDIKYTAQPVLQRKRSIFGWLQKKSEVEVDELIDLYLTDEQLEEVKSIRPKSSRSKLPTFRSRTVTDPLPLRDG